MSMQASQLSIYPHEGNLAPFFLYSFHQSSDQKLFTHSLCGGHPLVNCHQLILRNFIFKQPCLLTVDAYHQRMGTNGRLLSSAAQCNAWGGTYATHFMPTSNKKFEKIPWRQKFAQPHKDKGWAAQNMATFLVKNS